MSNINTLIRVLIKSDDKYYLYDVILIKSDHIVIKDFNKIILIKDLPESTKFFQLSQNNVTQKLKYLFPPIDDINKIQYDIEGLRFVTYAITSKAITKYVYNKIPSGNNITVIDLTSGLGGDTIEYGLQAVGLQAQRKVKIYALELNNIRYKCLKNNVSVYGLNSIITTINDNSVEFLNKILPRINSDDFVVISLDPPWGGDDYWKIPEIRDLWLFDKKGEKISIYIIIDMIIEKIEKFILILKLPNNFIQNNDKLLSNKISIEEKHFHKNIKTIILTSTL